MGETGEISPTAHHPLISELPRLSVLIVEDDPDTCENLRDILELDDCRVVTATSAAEALSCPDLATLSAILLDRRLPDATAETLLPRLRTAAADASVIIVTGHADIDSAIAALRLGAADYILKPINPDALRASLRRIAVRQQSEAMLRDRDQRLLQSERLAAVGQAITGLAHESRNALQRSQACLEMLARRVSDLPEALDLVQRIQTAQDDLHRLYEEVREYAAPITIEREQCDLGDVLHEAWDNLYFGRQERRTQLNLELLTDNLQCEADRFAIRRVFQNILENSMGACPDPVEVMVQFSDAMLNAAPALTVSMRDNGPGLTSEQRERIFEAFFTTKTKGTGLGMAICQRIVLAHGGEIAVGPGPGAEILVTLPRQAKNVA